MKKFKKLEEYSDDELIIIVHDNKENWQKEAVDYAKNLLLERGISDDFAQIRIKNIRKKIDVFWKRELEERQQESFSITELILIIFLWHRYILRDWYLNRDGYTKKRKQRLCAIGGGMLLYLIIFLNAKLSSDIEEQRIQEINQIAKEDSIAISKTDWSGLYVFIDTAKVRTNKTVWELIVQKKNSEHTAKLRLINKDKTLTIDCVGLIKKENFEFYPDTTYLLFDGVRISYYDRLFTFTRDSHEVFTYWGKMKPFNHPKYNANGLFKDATAANTRYKKLPGQ